MWWKTCPAAALSPHPRVCSAWDTPRSPAKRLMGAQGRFALTQSLCPCTEGNAQTTSPRAAALHGGPACLEGVRAMLGFFSLAFWSTDSMVVRQEVERGQARYCPDMEQCCDILWHFADLNFKYF